MSTTFQHHHHGNSIHGFQRTIIGIAKIHRVRLFSKTAFGQDVATQVKIRQNVATTTIMAMGEDGATKVEPAIRGFGKERANRGAHRGLGPTASGEEVTSHMDHPTMSHDVRRFAKVRVHAPAAK